MPRSPAACSVRSALSVTFSAVWLLATVLIPISRTRLLWPALSVRHLGSRGALGQEAALALQTALCRAAAFKGTYLPRGSPWRHRGLHTIGQRRSAAGVRVQLAGGLRAQGCQLHQATTAKP